MKLTSGHLIEGLARTAIGAFVSLSFLSPVLVAAGGQLASLEQRGSGADRVVVATARSVTPEWRENVHGDRIIVSKVLLEIEENLKGSGPSSALLEIDGGTLDGLTLRVSGLHLLDVGERAVVFLDEAAGGVHLPYLRGQGILALDAQNFVRGSSLRLDDIRTRVRGR